MIFLLWLRVQPCLVFLGQRADVVLEGVGHPAALDPYIAHALQRVPVLVACSKGEAINRRLGLSACWAQALQGETSRVLGSRTAAHCRVQQLVKVPVTQ